MKNIYTIFVALLLLVSLSVMGKPNNLVKITGQAAEYAGDSLHFMTYTDYLTLEEKTIASAKVSPDGTFEVQFPLTETEQVFMHLGTYKLYLYVQANCLYNIMLPPKSEKSQTDLLNPYFEENELFIGVSNYKDNNLNFLIQAFDNSFLPYLNKYALNTGGKSITKELNSNYYAYNMHAKAKPEELTATLQSLETSFPERKDSFFAAYFYYKTGLLRHWSSQYKARAISFDCFKNQPVLYKNPAYMELFSVIYDRYFNYFGRSPQGAGIYTAINTNKSLSALKQILNQDSVFINERLKELVILKCLYDEYYQPNFTRSSILTLVDSMSTNALYAESRDIAQRMKYKITRLMAGYEPPTFSLADTTGKMYTLDRWKGKLVYLNFCASFSYSSMKDFTLMQNLKDKLGDKIEIVTILADNSEAARSFLRQKKYNWTFLSFEKQPDVLKAYSIRAFPSYFVISPEGKLLRSPAKSPSEGIENDLFKIEQDRIRKEGQ